MTHAKAFDNRADRKVTVSDMSRPFVAIKPKGYLNPLIGRYATMKSAKRAASHFNKKMDV